MEKLEDGSVRVGPALRVAGVVLHTVGVIVLHGDGDTRHEQALPRLMEGYAETNGGTWLA